MEDTTMLSTSASTLRTLSHGRVPELEQQQSPLATATDPSSSSSSSSSTTTSSGFILPSVPDTTASPNLSPIHSTPHSPSIDSVSESSLPSVSSSFFFSSSAAGSPGRSRYGSYPGSYPHSDHEQDKAITSFHPSNSMQNNNNNLIIPSITLPQALRQPSPFGQTLGVLRLLVLGAQGAGKSFLTGLLLEDNEDVVEVGTWEDWEAGASSPGVASDVDGSFGYGKVLRASTDWLERRDAFGSERYEPTRNVHIVELPGYSQDADPTELVSRLKSIIEVPFRELYSVLHPDIAPSGIVASLLASPTSPLYTAMVFLLPSSPIPLDLQIVSSLSTHIPLIVLPRLHGPHRDSPISETFPKLSTFQPSSAVALRSGLFHSPETVALLRSEAADRFLMWREIERSVDMIMGIATTENEQVGLSRSKRRRLGEKRYSGGGGRNFEEERDLTTSLSTVSTTTTTTTVASGEKWNKAKWEAEWLENFSKDVDVMRRMRELTVTERTFPAPKITTENENSGKLESPDSKSTEQQPRPSSPPYFDPLHLSSLIAFSVSLLGPLKTRVEETVQDVWLALSESQVKAALLSGFCFGFGVGIGFFSRR